MTNKSQYGQFWQEFTLERAFRHALEEAATSGKATPIPADGLKECSKAGRKSWYGTVLVCSREIVSPYPGNLAAHARSLGKVVAKSGDLVCDWPDVLFRFTIDASGGWLTVEAAKMRSMQRRAWIEMNDGEDIRGSRPDDDHARTAVGRHGGVLDPRGGYRFPDGSVLRVRRGRIYASEDLVVSESSERIMEEVSIRRRECMKELANR